MKKSQVYTKSGDKGTTSLIGGTRVKKHHIKLEAYGTVDELNSFIGMIRSYDIDEHSRKTLINIQNKLFVIGAYLATDENVSDLKDRLDCKESDIEALELEMDQMENNLTPMRHFVLPGGNPTVSHCHIARTVCRRTERIINQLMQDYEIDPWVNRYINRLSDYLFVLSRYLTKKLNTEEILWLPDL